MGLYLSKIYCSRLVLHIFCSHESNSCFSQCISWILVASISDQQYVRTKTCTFWLSNIRVGKHVDLSLLNFLLVFHIVFHQVTSCNLRYVFLCFVRLQFFNHCLGIPCVFGTVGCESLCSNLHMFSPLIIRA